MDRHAFLDALPYLRPVSREQLQGEPVWSGAASFSLSLEEQFSAAAQDAPHSPLGAFAKDVSWLYFSVSEQTCEDATQLRAALHVGTSGEVVFVLDGRAYAVHGPSIKHVSARMPDSVTQPHHLPPSVTVLFARVTLTLMPANNSAWPVEAPLLQAAAAALVRARAIALFCRLRSLHSQFSSPQRQERSRAVALSAAQAPTAEDAAAIAADAESALLRWREAVGGLAAAATAPLAAGSVVQCAAAAEALGAAAVTLRGAADAGAIGGACEHAQAQLDAEFAAAFPALHNPRHGDAEQAARLMRAFERMDTAQAAALAAALAPS